MSHNRMLSAGSISFLTMILLAIAFAHGASSFDLTLPPQGWSVTKGQLASGPGISAEKANVIVRSNEPITAPAELTFRVKVPEKKWAMFQLIDPSVTDAKAPPAMALRLYRYPGNRIQVSAKSENQPMAMNARSVRQYNRRDVNSGATIYSWRYDFVSNMWDDNDRADIGADYAELTNFDDKLFVLRVVLGSEGRQVWLDDRLVAESREAAPKQLHVQMQLLAGAQVHAFEVNKSYQSDGFHPVPLDDYQTDGKPRASKGVSLIGWDAGTTIPMRLVSNDSPDINLSKSLYRFRMTLGTGPGAPYVNARSAYPNPLRVDPSISALRVPYRVYKNVWLVAWVDDSLEHGVPRGTVRFYRDMAGYCATSEFEITPEAIEKGDVKQLSQKTADGKTRYLVRVPVNSADFYGFNDLSDNFLDVQITKPVYLLRSYPDPIYCGHHPGGPPSSVRVTGITFEEAAFGYEVIPLHHGHVFEQPEKPSYTVRVTNRTDKAQTASVVFATKSYDGKEKNSASTSELIEAGKTKDIKLHIDNIKTLGWHELETTVELAGEERGNTLSLVLLPPNDRTYGDAPNETRFGAWNLWGHYVPFVDHKPEINGPILATLRKIGIRRIGAHSAFMTPDFTKQYDFLPKGPHTVVSVYHRLDEKDPEQVEKMLKVEESLVKPITDNWKTGTYHYGGEWGFDHTFTHAANPRYTGDGPWHFDEKAMANLKRQMFIFETIGERLRKVAPNIKLILQWGGPQNTIPFLENDFPKKYVDGYGVDMPNFELTPELPVGVGTINYLWTVRQEVARTGWPQHGFHWVEGPFLPTNEGALTEVEQEQNYVRYWLAGLAYNVESFEAGIVPHDGGNYYGAEHYGAGVFKRIPLVCPKPAVAALATATSMLCGSDLVGPIKSDVLTSYGLSFYRKRDNQHIHALWRVRGQCDVTLDVSGKGNATVVNAMGNRHNVPIKDGKVTVATSPSPVWLIDAGKVTSFTSGTPKYDEKPAEHAIELTKFSSYDWKYDGSAIPSYATNHHATSRKIDMQLGVTFSTKDAPHGPTADVTLPAQKVDDRPLSARYGSIVAAKPVAIPGKAKALGIWMEGNASWGRVVYELKDAKGETWTSIGTKDDWNCDDTFTWSYANFEGWRYLRFPLPGHRPYDLARELEFTWWKHEGGDGVVDLPLSLTRIIVETRNSVHHLGEMKVVTDRTYRLAGLTAEYADKAHMTDEVLPTYAVRRVTPKWQGPIDNPIARMKKENTLNAPTIKGWEEPHHWNDGRRMHIRFDEDADMKYVIYMSRYPDGRGAEQVRGTYKDKQLVRGMRPGIDMYFFLVAMDAQKQKSKPSAAYKLVTEDKFAEK